jgi:prepilin-type N-terminal cleavage/methylation domain-containing protein
MKIKKPNIKNNFSLFTSHFSSQKGYTLVELLTVIGILSVIGVIVLSVLFITLRGTEKSNALEIVRQNGDAALSQMVKDIRYAKTLETPGSCSPATTTSSVTIISLNDSGRTTYSCTGTTIASNSASLLDTNAVSTTSCSFVCRQDRPSDPPTITIQYSLSARQTGNLTETTASIPFQTSVTMRNYTR